MSELYELPDGWIEKKLNTLCKLEYGKNLPTTKMLKVGYSVFGANGIIGSYSEYNCENIEVLISCRGANSGVVNLSPSKSFITNNSIRCKRLDEKNIDKMFLYYYLKTYDKSNIITGSAQPQVTIQSLDLVSIPLPPLPEQQRIVSKLDLLFEKIDRSIALHQKNMDEANAFMGSVLNDVFGELEENHHTEILKNILEKAQYGFSNKSSDDGIYPFLRMGDLQNGKILLNNLKYVNLSKIDFLKYKLDKYDLLFNRTNSFELVGKTSIYENDMDMTFASYLVRLKVKQEKIIPYFLNYFLNAKNTQNTLKEMATKAINQSNINAQKLQSISIPIPPLPIQQKTVTYLDEISQKIEKIKQLQKEKMASLKALKASILDSAFRGEL